ncbi:MAG: glycerophosphoryl diester phosphodiesterase [Gammaproteobacteria bacterium]
MSSNHKLFFPPIIAHRGASALAPENTLAAFRKAREIGAKWVEFDVMLAACGEAVVIHDETLERTTNGFGQVCDYPASYLQTLDAGSWFAPQFKNEKIPTLAEVIDFLCQEQLAANIEIKPSIGREEETVKKVLELIEQCWKHDILPPIISSFSTKVLYQVRQYSLTSLLAFLMHEWREDWQAECDALNCMSVDVNQMILNPYNVKEIKDTGRLLLAYTVDDVMRARELWSWGVDAVFTNCPPAMLRV